ncbi:MAG: hypothetical protein G01um101425_242 [Candidatus Peregrinibacteria bacterium Gr01-1014_25]|nr:MAG: hypothetical protein G01um101425_242 [Candidatus Peregrinibacteria bacterium Gr01-1014_25]
MILLVCGASDMARRMLAEKFVREQEGWKHLPLERVHQLMEREVESDDPTLFLRVACHCARELAEDGTHVILSHPEATEHVALLREELEPGFTAFHLGPIDEEGADPDIEEAFDYLIDSRQHSVNDAFELIVGVLAQR